MGTYSGGTGLASNPYLIGTVEDWEELASTSGDWNKYFKVTHDIDFLGAELNLIGTLTTKFNGTFDGQGYTFSNGVVKNDPDLGNAVAMFRRSGPNSVIKNLNLNNFSVSMTSTPYEERSYCAILLGEAEFGGLVNNCHATNCEVSKTKTSSSADNYGYAGVIIASNHGRISNCSVSGGFVKGDNLSSSAILELVIGGVIGYQTGAVANGVMDNCHSTASIGSLTGASDGPISAGGVLGAIHSLGEVHNSTFNGIVSISTAKGINLGGITGYSEGIMEDCSGAGEVTLNSTSVQADRNKIGGIMGRATSSSSSNRTNFIGNINAPSVASTLHTGGICGECYGTMLKCYYEGDITINQSVGTTHLGGMFGTIRGTAIVDGCYCDTNLNIGYASSYTGGGIGQSTSAGAAISNCYARGTIYDANTSSTSLNINIWGGFIAYGSGATILNCYTSIGPWSNSSVHREGFIGNNNGSTITDCFADSTIAGHASTLVDGGEWKTAIELQTPSTYDNTGFNFDPFNNRVWKMEPGIYPLLAWQETAKGYGIETSTGDLITLNKPDVWADGFFVDENGVETPIINESLSENVVTSNTNITTSSYLLKEGTRITLQSDYALYNYSQITENGLTFIGKFDENIYSEIRYTVNGKNPTRTSKLYTGPIVLYKNLSGTDNLILKYKVFYQGKESETKTIDIRII